MILNIISLIIITIEKMTEDEKKDKRRYPYLYYNNFKTKKEGSSKTLVVSYNQAFCNTLILFA